LKETIRILTKDKREKEVKTLESFGVIKHIPNEYGLSLPMDAFEKVKDFTDNLDRDIFVDEVSGQPRNRRVELVIIF
jgi:hypothetical protein